MQNRGVWHWVGRLWSHRDQAVGGGRAFTGTESGGTSQSTELSGSKPSVEVGSGPSHAGDILQKSPKYLVPSWWLFGGGLGGVALLEEGCHSEWAVRVQDSHPFKRVVCLLLALRCVLLLPWFAPLSRTLTS